MKPDNSERNARIVEMRKAGNFPREIAKALGVSRNVVIGVTNRAGLSDPNVDRSAAMEASVRDGSGVAKLSPDDIREIRARYRPHCRFDGGAAIARDAGVSPDTIRDIIRGHTWAHVQ